MRRTKIQIGLILSILSLLLISINPVVGYVSTKNAIEESIVEMDDTLEYIAIPTVYYQKFEEIVDDIEDEELRESLEEMIADWEDFSYGDGVTIYIPILCECFEFLLLIFITYAFIMDEILLLPSPIAEAIVITLYVITKTIC